MAENTTYIEEWQKVSKMGMCKAGESTCPFMRDFDMLHMETQFFFDNRGAADDAGRAAALVPVQRIAHSTHIP